MTHRAYCFTLFFDGDTLDLSPHLGGLDVVRYAIWQLERCPASSKLHLQGYVELRTPMRVRAAAGLLGPDARPHVEPRKGSRESARDYCKKEDSRISGPWEVGSWENGGTGRRNDRAALKVAIDGGADDGALWDDHFSVMLSCYKAVGAYRLIAAKLPRRERVDVTCYWGPTGTGKSYRALAEASCNEGDELGTPYMVPRTGGETWFDGYDPIKHKTIIIDEFYGWIQWSQLLRILDHYPLNLSIKGGFVPAAYTRIYITSNKSPISWYDKDKVGDVTPLLRRINKCIRMDTPYW